VGGILCASLKNPARRLFASRAIAVKADSAWWTPSSSGKGRSSGNAPCLIEKLVVYPERMQANLDALGGIVHSQRVMLALTQAGASREEAYTLVQTHAMATWREGGSFKDRLLADPAVRRRLKPKQIEAMFDLAYHFKHVDAIFRRVFGSGSKRR